MSPHDVLLREDPGQSSWNHDLRLPAREPRAVEAVSSIALIFSTGSAAGRKASQQHNGPARTSALAVAAPGAIDGAQLRRGFPARRQRGEVSDRHIVVIVSL